MVLEESCNHLEGAGKIVQLEVQGHDGSLDTSYTIEIGDTVNMSRPDATEQLISPDMWRPSQSNRPKPISSSDSSFSSSFSAGFSSSLAEVVAPPEVAAAAPPPPDPPDGTDANFEDPSAINC